MLRLGNGIELAMGPTALGAPDDLEATITDFLARAESSLDVAVQELDSRSIATVLIAAKRRGVKVRVILEGDYLWERAGAADPWAPLDRGHEENRLILNALLRAGIDVVSDLNPAIFHQKFVVRDPDETRAAVLTGSTNFTLTDTGANTATAGSVVGNNLNHVLVLHGRTAAGLYEGEFDRLRDGTFGDRHARVEAHPKEFGLGRIRVKPLFAPRHGPEMEIMKQMLKARSRIDFAMFTFSNSSGIDDAMIRLATVDPPVRIAGVIDNGQGRQTWAATDALKAAGVDLRVSSSKVRKLHHKLMVIDEQLVIAGSFNYTGPATTLNDENIVVLGDLEETDPDAIAAQRTLAAYALAEIGRIRSDLGEPA